MLQRFKRRFVGDRAFYKTVMAIVVPIIVQNSISNFVNLLDNIMVGQVGTDQMSGVAIANQLIFVFNLCVFGGLSGAGIFGAQFFGAGDVKGLRDTFRFKVLTSIVLFAVGLAIFLEFGEPLVSLYLSGEAGTGDAAVVRASATGYLNIMLAGLPLFALTQCYAGTLREMGQTKLPMLASVAAVLTNLLFNWLLIFGVPGVFPAYNERGAAYATVISRVVELSIVVVGTHRNKQRYPFIVGAFKSLRVPKALTFAIIRRGAPLLLNEGLWSMGMATLTQTYSLRGLTVVAATNIASTVSNLFNVVFLSMGNALAVLVGQALGANDMEKAKDSVWKLIAFSVACCFLMGALLAAVSPLIPMIYNTTEDVRALATMFVIVNAVFMPINAITHCCYFTLRSGGRTIITFLFDCVHTWLICVPCAMLLARLTTLPITVIYPACVSQDLIKCVIGLVLVKKGVWVRNLVS